MASLPKSLSDQRTGLVKAASVAEAKANFSSIVRRVEQERAEIIVMRRGVAVAKIIPFEQPKETTGYGWMRGTVTEVGDIVGPIGEEWDAGSE